MHPVSFRRPAGKAGRRTSWEWGRCLVAGEPLLRRDKPAGGTPENLRSCRKSQRVIPRTPFLSSLLLGDAAGHREPPSRPPDEPCCRDARLADAGEPWRYYFCMLSPEDFAGFFTAVGEGRYTGWRSSLMETLA